MTFLYSCHQNNFPVGLFLSPFFIFFNRDNKKFSHLLSWWPWSPRWNGGGESSQQGHRYEKRSSEGPCHLTLCKARKKKCFAFYIYFNCPQNFTKACNIRKNNLTINRYNLVVWSCPESLFTPHYWLCTGRQYECMLPAAVMHHHTTSQCLPFSNVCGILCAVSKSTMSYIFSALHQWELTAMGPQANVLALGNPAQCSPTLMVWIGPKIQPSLDVCLTF